MIDAPNARFGLAGTLDNHKVLGRYLPTLVLDGESTCSEPVKDISSCVSSKMPFTFGMGLGCPLL